jgi:hypothetical protein
LAETGASLWTTKPTMDQLQYCSCINNNMVGITESNLTHPLLWDVDDLLLQEVDALRDVDALQRGDANLTHHVLPSFYRPKRGYIADKTVQTPQAGIQLMLVKVFRSK